MALQALPMAQAWQLNSVRQQVLFGTKAVLFLLQVVGITVFVALTYPPQLYLLLRAVAPLAAQTGWAPQPRSVYPEELLSMQFFPLSTLLKMKGIEFAPSTCLPLLLKQSPG